MKNRMLLLALTTLALLASNVAAAGGPRLSCDDLKARIDAKLQEKGVKNYSLEAVEQTADAGDAKVVGTCDGNSRKMLYKRGAAPTNAQALKTEAPKADAPKAEAPKAASPAAPATKAESKPAAKP